jgi:hypothetical protein
MPVLEAFPQRHIALQQSRSGEIPGEINNPQLCICHGILS